MILPRVILIAFYAMVLSLVQTHFKSGLIQTEMMQIILKVYLQLMKMTTLFMWYFHKVKS